MSLFASATIWSPDVSEAIKLLPLGSLDKLTESEMVGGKALSWKKSRNRYMGIT